MMGKRVAGRVMAALQRAMDAQQRHNGLKEERLAESSHSMVWHGSHLIPCTRCAAREQRGQAIG